MQKAIWLYVLAAAVVGAGGWFYYVHQRITVNVNMAASAPPSVAAAQPKPSDDELNRKRLEGIGSIRDLKPVPLPPSSGKGR